MRLHMPPLARRLIGQPEFWSGIAVTLWAKWLWLGAPDLSENEAYSVVTQLLTEKQMEWIAFLIGLAQLAAVLWNRRWPRAAMGALSALFFLSLANAIWMATPNAPGCALFVTLGGMNVGLSLLLCCPRRWK